MVRWPESNYGLNVLTHIGLCKFDLNYTPIDTPNLFLWEACYGGSTVKFGLVLSRFLYCYLLPLGGLNLVLVLCLVLKLHCWVDSRGKKASTG